MTTHLVEVSWAQRYVRCSGEHEWQHMLRAFSFFSQVFFLLSLVFHLIVASLRTLLKIVDFVSYLLSGTRAASQVSPGQWILCPTLQCLRWHFIITKHLSEESLVRNLHEQKSNSSINYSKTFIFFSLSFKCSGVWSAISFRIHLLIPVSTA